MIAMGPRAGNGTPSNGAEVRERPGDDLRRILKHEIALLIRSRRAIVANVSIVVVLGFVTSLTVGDKYVATASVLPPTRAEVGTLDYFVRQLPVAIGPRGAATVMHEVEQVIQSRHVGYPVVETHDLVDVYGSPSVQLAFNRMRNRLEVAVQPSSQMMYLSFEDGDPERASAVLRSLVEETDAFYRETRRSRGRLLVDLVSARLDSTSHRLAELEVLLGDFETENATLQPSRSATREVSQLTGRAMMLEVQLEAMTHYLHGSSPLQTQWRAELGSIHDRLRQLPEVELEDLRLRRDLLVHRALHDLLTSQLAAAHVLAAQEIPFIDVLDAPIAPRARSWPVHVKFVLSAFLIGLASSVLLAHVVEFVESNRKELRRIGA